MTAEERAEHQIRMAKAVDEASRVAETERILDVVAREAYNPDIKPTDAEWIKKREEIVALLQDKKKSVLKLLKELGIEDRSFKALQLLPPKTEDLALELQRENTELYKKAMGPGGPFEHIHDNLATKLTMLHFELPIEPLTLKNVTNCEMDIDDPPDDEEEAPRVQRIIYSEKALQFLDCYHERSFGFPMLRIDENSQPPGQNSVRHGPSHQHRARQPVQPTGDLLRIRGGGGTSSNRYLYSRYGASIKLEAIDNEVPADEFRRAALKALDLHPDSAWAIVVDQFDNSEDLKETIVKPFATSFVVRSSDFNKIYESHLKARISNQLENCILSVDYYHLRTNGEINTDPFIIPLRSRSGRDTLDLTKLPKVRPKNNKDATHLPTLPQVSTPSRGAQTIPTSSDFGKQALKLLGLDPRSHWEFAVDFYSNQLNRVDGASHALDFSHTVRIRKASLEEQYLEDIQPLLFRGEEDWAACAKVSAKRLAPPDDLRHYVILRRPGRESYWKLPTPLDDRYGMNQLQDAFFAAMLVHYPLGSLRPPQSVNFNTDLGYGGMEITQDFWDTITGYFSRYSDQAFTVCGNIPPASTDLSKGMGIRLAGTHRYGTFQPRDFTGLAKALRELSQAVIFDKAQNYTSPPTTFRAWYTAENRENNVDSHIFYYDDNDPNAPRSMALEDSLKAWFQSESIRKSTNCIWFRPEWKQFTIIDDSTSDLGDMDVDHTNETWDATVDSSLDSFRDMLVMLYGDGDDDYPENFEIIIPRTNQRFVINRQTTEDSWRKHVFDYFHHNTLIVKRSDGIPCSNGNENDNGYGNSKYTSDEPPPVVQPPHEPRRIPGAKPPVFGTTEVPKFDEWMLNHTAQNTLQQRSWTQDQSVIEPGYAPAAPLYGDNLELAITAGPSMPTVFTQHLTPTDIMQLRKENRKLLNHALEREIGCPICNMTFKAYDNDSKAAHFKDHIDQLNSVGTCPMCNETWALFTFEQKRNHLLADFAKKESQDILQFWEDTRCPICNLELRSKSAEDVTTHIASHVPGALKFCDRCGFDVLACAPAEKAHHDRVCTRNTSVREPGMPDPIICQNCGKERTPASENIREHDLCGNGQFCIRCRLDLSFLDAQEQHEHFKRCRVPGGAAGTNCKRCGKKLAGLSARGLASHNNEC
ncbi:hypothetical protein BKA61DRAFT_510071, partial [Leptodontidium sp. MPI-SDFR-AT-0119]